MKRSGSCSENMGDLILAALANPNGRYKGRTLLEYCYRKMDVRQTFRHFSWEDRTPYVTLYEMLLADGADADIFLRKNAEDFSYLQKATCEALKLIRVLHSGDRLNGKRAKRILPLSCAGDLEAVQTAVLKGAAMPFTCVDAGETNELNGMNSMVASFFEDCMRGIYMLNQPCLPLLEAAILNGADVSFLYNGAVAPIYTVERLLTVSADALRLLTETMRGRGAW